MKRLLAFILLCPCLLICGCSKPAFMGFYEEDLTKYLTLGEYNGIEYEMPSVNVIDAEIEAEISSLLEAQAILEVFDGACNEGSVIKLDRFCFINGVSKPELSEMEGIYTVSEKYDSVIDSILTQLIGMKKSDSKRVTVTLPEGYKGIITAQTTAEYEITVTEVYKKTVPQLNDETASKLITGCKSVKELKDNIRTRLEGEKTQAIMNTVESQIKKTIIDRSDVKKTPLTVFNGYYDDIKTLYEGLAKAQGMALEDYLSKNMNMTAGEFEEQLKKQAADETKEALVLYSIVKKENIECNDKLLFAYASRMADASNGIFASGEEYLNYYGENAVTEDYLWERVLEIAIKNGSPVNN